MFQYKSELKGKFHEINYINSTIFCKLIVSFFIKSYSLISID